MVLRGIIKFYQLYQNQHTIIVSEQWLSGNGGPIIVDSWRILSAIIWRDCDTNTHHYGGDYVDIDRKARQLVEKLRRCMYDPIFIFTGLYPHNFKSQEQAHPPLLIPVLLSVLRSMDVKIIQADHHTITTIVLLANRLHCPILSNRTDFLGCLVKEGVALVLNEKSSAGLTDSEDKLRVDVFWNCRRFMEIVDATDDDFRIFSAVLTYHYTDHGAPATDWIPYSEIFDAIRDREHLSFDDRVSEIFNACNLCDYANVQEFRERVESYKPDDELHSYLVSDECRLLTYRGRELPDRYQQRWRERKLPPYLMSILSTRQVDLPSVLEDPNQRSAFECSRPLREASYAILLGFDDEPPEETMKVGEERVKVSIPVLSRMQLPPYTALPRLEDVPALKRKARREIVSGVLGTNADRRIIKEYPPEFQFVLSVTCYWKRQTIVSTEHVRALLAALVKYLTEENTPIVEHDEFFSRELRQHLGEMSDTKKLKILHTFTEWQAIFLDASQLNQLLLSPFGEPSPSFFQSSFLIYAVDMMREGDDFDVQIREEFGEDRFLMLNQLCQFVQQNTES